MKKVVLSLITTLAIGTVTLSAADSYGSVNGDKITKEDVALVLQDPNINFTTLPKPAQKQIIEQIINKKLLAKEAINTGIKNDPIFKSTMKKMEDDLAFQIWQKNEIGKIKISEAQQKDFYSKNKKDMQVPELYEARHILVKTEKEAKALIKTLKSAPDSKAKFIQLAKTKSTGPSGPKGGYLGKFPAAQMVPEFSAALKNISANSFSTTPVKTQFGYHVIYSMGKTAGKSLSFNEVKGKISQMLVGNAYNKKVKEITDKLRKTAKIVIK